MKFLKSKINNISRFAKLLIYFICVFTVIICLFFLLLWQFLIAYEDATYSNVINEYLIHIKDKDYFQALKMATGSEDIGINSIDGFSQYVDGKYGNISEFDYYKTYADNQKANFDIYINSEYKDSLTVLNEGKKNFALFNHYKLKQPEDLYNKDYFFILPKDATLHLNGHNIGDENIFKDKLDFGSNNEALIDNLSIFKVSDVIGVPNVTVQNKDRSTLDTYFYDNENIFIASNLISGDKKEQVENIGYQVSLMYIKFLMGEINLNKLKPFLDDEGSLYKDLQDYRGKDYVGLFIETNNIIFENLVNYVDNCYFLNVSFDYIVQKGNEQLSYKIKYQVDFIIGEDITSENYELFKITGIKNLV
ncbi:MAG: hypothetical protein ACRCZK_00205 [Oscillospiraceae bacterium]